MNEVYYKPKECRVCKKRFIPLAGNQVYCTKKCRDKYFNDKRLKERRESKGNTHCILCLEPLPKNKEKFCSKRCASFFKAQKKIRKMREQRNKEREELGKCKDNITRKRYTEKDVKTIIKMWEDGKMAKEIAQKLKRTTGSVECKIRDLRKAGKLNGKIGRLNKWKQIR